MLAGRWRAQCLLLVVLTISATVLGQSQTGCRVCPATCLSIARTDGSCEVCVCGDVALPDCPPRPLQCEQGCREQPGQDGCLECFCPPVVCPQLPPCPDECVQLGEDGCPTCTCDSPQPVCPAFSCAEGCLTEIANDGCPRCTCAREGVCPPLPECLRGCLDLDTTLGCYTCNCSLVPSPAPRPAATEGQAAVTDVVESEDPTLRCRRQPRLRCQPGCRIAVSASSGCRECYCDEDAYLCPGVPSCASRCQYLSSEDRCCRCGCEGKSAPGGFTVTIGGVPLGSIPPLVPELPGVPRLPPALRPRPETPQQGQQCQNEPSSCDPECEDTVDSEGCRLCVCPGDLCPRIRCPEQCVIGRDANGCPQCDCGGGERPGDTPGNPADATTDPATETDPPADADPADPSTNPTGPTDLPSDVPADPATEPSDPAASTDTADVPREPETTLTDPVADPDPSTIDQAARK